MKHFQAKEFKCHCGCGTKDMRNTTLAMLEKAREIAGIPFIINSGRRCESHNKIVGGVKNSAHTRGYAVDICAITGGARFTIIQALLQAGFKRIGVYSNFIHVDNDPKKPSGVMWYGK